MNENPTMGGVSLKTKTLALIFVLIALLGGIVTHFVQGAVARQLADGLNRFGLAVAREVAEASDMLLLTRNRFALESLAAEQMTRFPELAYLFFTSPQGTVMAHTFGASFPDGLLEARFTSVRAEDIVPLETERGPVFHVMAPVMGGEAGMVHLGVRGQPLREQVAGTVATLLQVTGGVLTIGLLIGWLFMDRITRSLGLLVQGAEAVIRGDLNQRITLGGRDEVAQLATAFDRMTEQLARARDEQQAINHALTATLATVEERTRDLSRTNKDLQDFVYFVSHDLRSPLLSVQGFMEELRLDLEELGAVLGVEQGSTTLTPPAEVRGKVHTLLLERIPEDLGYVQAATVKMNNLINAILQLSRLGRLTLKPEPVTVRAVLDQTLRAMAHAIRQEEVTVTVAGSLPNVITDLHALEQIFANLLANAIKYRLPERPLTITLWGDVHATGNVTYGVKDNGRGIAEKDIPRIFGMFQRVGAQDTPGEGMGLAYTQTLVKRLGGSLECRSIPGRETTFLVTLPNLPVTDRSM